MASGLIFPFLTTTPVSLRNPPPSSKVDPLPEGTTDIDVIEARWNYVDRAKIVVCGGIDPQLNILDKLSATISVIKAADADAFAFAHPVFKRALIKETHEARNLIAKKHYKPGSHELQREMLTRIDICSGIRRHDNINWITDCGLPKRLLWSLQCLLRFLT